MEELTFEGLDAMLASEGNRAPFLVSLRDGPDNRLTVTVAPAVPGEVGELPDIAAQDNETGQTLREILSRCRPIGPDGERLFEISFEDYILYEVRSDSYAAWDGTEVRRGRWLCTFEKSNLLDNVEKTTNAFRFSDGTFYPGPWKHYGIYTQNHAIDVISHVPPAVREIKES